MRKNIYSALLGTLIILFAGACSAAPPIEPTTGFSPYSAPLSPSSVTATNGYSDTIEVTWDEVEGATSYQVWAVKAENYGTTTRSTSEEESYATLISRGFELLNVVYDTEYKIKGENSNSSYVFSIVAMKAMDSSSLGSTVLYSQPSKFVQGGTVGEIILSVIANSKQVSLYWDISNIYSVIDNSEARELLYSYRLSAFRKKTEDNDWGEGEAIDVVTNTTQSYSYQAIDMESDTQYDFKLCLEVLDDEGNVINSVESDTYTVTTDSTVIPESVSDITSTSGEKKNEVTLSWTAPTLPHTEDVEAVYTVERSSNGGANWTDLGEVTVPEYTDTDLASNTLYTYRIVSGYRIGERTTVYQNEEDAETIENVYSLWMPSDVTFSFSEKDSLSGTLKVTFTYNPPKVPESLECRISEDWIVENLSDKGSESKDYNVLPDQDGKCTLEWEISIPEGQSQTFLTFTFTCILSDTVSYTEKAERDFSLGETKAVDLISPVTASENWVGVIRLSWTENTAHDDIYTYKILENSSVITDLTIMTDENDSLGKYADIPVNEGLNHTYRIKVEKGDTFDSEEATGTVLEVPQGLSASDSTSVENITVTWPTEEDSAVRYRLEYHYDGESSWSELASVTYSAEEHTASALLEALRDGSDGRKVTFRLAAYNVNQSGDEVLYSKEETGSVFGPALLNVRVENSGLDPDKITLRWDEVEGAVEYTVYRNGTEIRTTGKTVYEDKVENIVNSCSSEGSDDYISPTDESYVPPMNRKYTYTVVPKLDEDTSAIGAEKSSSAKAEGELFAPPKDIKATKGENEILLSWSEAGNADYYEIRRTSVTLKNGEEKSWTSADKTDKDGNTEYNTTEECSYKEKDEELQNSSIRYEVRSVMVEEDGTEVRSQWQSGYTKSRNVLGFYENDNIGYRIQDVPQVAAYSVKNEKTGYYEDYIRVEWYASSGATSYTITCYTSLINSAKTKVRSFEVQTDTLKYSETETTDNGKEGKGRLTYDPKSGLYTYYAGNDDKAFDAYVIDTCEIVANCSSFSSGSVSSPKTLVFRQPTAGEWINIATTAMRPAFKSADTSFSGDWWDKSSKTYTSSSGMTFTSPNSTVQSSGNLAVDTKLSIDGKGEISLTTVTPIALRAVDGNEWYAQGYLGTDPLQYIGYDNTGTLKITAGTYDSYKIMGCTISYKSVNVYSVEGSYTVTMDDGTTSDINDSAEFTRLLGD